MEKFYLEIITFEEELVNLYKSKDNYNNDSGVDLYIPKETIVHLNSLVTINMNIKCKLYDKNNTRPFMIVPRSSINNTPLILNHSPSIYFDNEDIILNFRCLPDKRFPEVINNGYYIIPKHSKLTQLLDLSGNPISIKMK